MNKPKIGIIPGDPGGIGPELIANMWAGQVNPTIVGHVDRSWPPGQPKSGPVYDGIYTIAKVSDGLIDNILEAMDIHFFWTTLCGTLCRLTGFIAGIVHGILVFHTCWARLRRDHEVTDVHDVLR